jgi:hypothetical protein
MRAIYLIMYVIAALFFAAPVALSGTDGEEVVLVTSVSGDVRVLAGEEEEKALKIGMRLHIGDEVIAYSGKASLVFFSGSYIALAAGERLLLGGTLEESTLKSGGTTRGLVGEDALPVLEQGLTRSKKREVWQAQLASVSGIRGDGLPVAVAPRLTIASENPHFYWFDTDTSGSGDERRYLLLLRAEDGTVLARRELQGRTGRLNSFRFAQLPDGFTASPRMHYEWSVLPAGAAEPAGRLDASFVFVDREGMELARKRSARLRELQAGGAYRRNDTCTLFIANCISTNANACSRMRSRTCSYSPRTDEGKDYAASRLARTFLRFRQPGVRSRAALPRPSCGLSRQRSGEPDDDTETA